MFSDYEGLSTVPVSTTTCHVSRVRSVISVTRVMWAGHQETEERGETDLSRMGCSCLAGGARLDELMRMPCTALGETFIPLSEYYQVSRLQSVSCLLMPVSECPYNFSLLPFWQIACGSLFELNIQIPVIILMSPHTRNMRLRDSYNKLYNKWKFFSL